ncbi:MAG: NUDIX domain-containing protein [Eubacterium sp.]|nr:NUDIX domain-containing protein [Eubacterium sp.]
MKQICEITDKDILDRDGYSNAKPRLTARAIVKNKENMYAIMYSEDFDFYSLPGGAVEENEDICLALKREIAEETGCTCDRIEELGYVYENRGHCDYTQISYYFVVTTNDTILKPVFTDDENAHRTSVSWYTLDEAIKLIASPIYDKVQRKFLQARDIAALKEYTKNNLME